MVHNISKLVFWGMWKSWALWDRDALELCKHTLRGHLGQSLEDHKEWGLWKLALVVSGEDK